MFLQQIDGQGPPLAPHPAIAEQVAQVVAKLDQLRRQQRTKFRNLIIPRLERLGKISAQKKEIAGKSGHLALVKKVVGDQADEVFDADESGPQCQDRKRGKNKVPSSFDVGNVVSVETDESNGKGKTLE